MYKYAIMINDTIVNLTNNVYDTIKYAKIKYPSAKYISLANEEDILNDMRYNPGIYIISDIHITKIYEKKLLIHKGFIFNRKKYVMKHIITITINEIVAPVKQYKNNLPTIQQKDVIYTPKIIDVAKNTHILSIGNNDIKHIEFIDMIIKNVDVLEENIIIISNNCNTWFEKHPTCIIFEYSDVILTHIYKNCKNNILIIFDNCLNIDLIDEQFYDCLRLVKNIIIMTDDANYLLHKQFILQCVLIHSYTNNWTDNISNTLINHFECLKDNNTLDKYIKLGCIALDKTNIVKIL